MVSASHFDREDHDLRVAAVAPRCRTSRHQMGGQKAASDSSTETSNDGFVGGSSRSCGLHGSGRRPLIVLKNPPLRSRVVPA